MRKISPFQIICFVALFSLILVMGIKSSLTIFSYLELNEYGGIVNILGSIFFSYFYAFSVFGVFMKITPLKSGEINKDSSQEFIYHVYLLFFLIIFYPVMRSGAMPVPLMRIVYLLLGAKLGDNTYSSGIILDPMFVEIGSNSIVGQFALIIPHVIENEKLGHYPVKIGNNVTIGANAIVMAGVTIEDNALVATGALVKKGTHIPAGEIWGGVPAKCIRKSDATTARSMDIESNDVLVNVA